MTKTSAVLATLVLAVSMAAAPAWAAGGKVRGDNAAALFALAIPAMASNGHVMKENNNQAGIGYLNMVDNISDGQQLLARGGAGRGGGNGAGKGSGHKNGTGNGGNGSANGPGDGTGQRGGGYGPGDGTGNGGSGPRDGSGNGPKTGDCDQTP